MKDPWIKVESESELREGMAVQSRPCIWCGRTETVILARRYPASDVARGPDGTTASVSKWCWDAPGRCRPYRVHMGKPIREGRLFRLSDDALSTDTATTERMRERVRAR